MVDRVWNPMMGWFTCVAALSQADCYQSTDLHLPAPVPPWLLSQLYKSDHRRVSVGEAGQSLQTKATSRPQEVRRT